MNYTTRENCRVCQGRLEEILTLGNQHLVGFTLPDTDALKRGYPHASIKPVYVPLDLMLCSNCHLLQLKHTTNAELLWNENYGYKSGINETMKKELADIVASTTAIKRLEEGDVVVDIGSNDGTLLNAYSNPDIIRVGYEPSRNVAQAPDVPIGKFKLFVDFFNRVPFLQEFSRKKAKIITSVAMFYDLEDPNRFIEDVEAILDPEGVFIIQQNYLVGMLEQNAFDNIVHEHLEYYSLLSLESLLAQNNLEVFDVSQNDINGGSFRTYIRFKGAKIDVEGGQERVIAMRKRERELGLDKKDVYLKFASRVAGLSTKLSTFVNKEVKKGKKVYVYGASTRGNTLLQAAVLNSKQITAAAERNAFKWGRKCVGTNIPIISEEEARKAQPDYFLVLPWFFKKEFIEREKEYLETGGKLIFPLPEFEIIGKED